MTGIAISAVVHFLRMECLMQCLGNMVDVLDVSGTFLGGQLRDLTATMTRPLWLCSLKRYTLEEGSSQILMPNAATRSPSMQYAQF